MFNSTKLVASVVEWFGVRLAIKTTNRVGFVLYIDTYRQIYPQIYRFSKMRLYLVHIYVK